MKLKYSVLFPRTKNTNFGKHTIAIPYTFAKLYGMEAEVITYKNEDYPSFPMVSDKIKLSFIPRKYKDDFRNFRDYFLKHAKSIDILEFIHRDSINYRLNHLYKRLNKKGKSYLKMDVGRGIIQRLKKDKRNFFKEFGRRFYVNKFDCISVEPKEVYNFAKNYYRQVYKYKKLIHVPNGYFVPDKFLNQDCPWQEKENIMMTVGRIGTRQKANEIFLEALGKVQNEIRDWKVYFVGEIKNSFQQTINKFFIKYPNLKKQIIFTGIINDREKVCDLFKRSKIFCFTSRWEGFANVPIEAGFFRNYIISTKTAGALDVLDQGRLGSLINFDDTEQLATVLKKVIHDDKLLRKKSFLQREWVRDNFNWDKICKRLYKTLFKKNNK